MNNKNDRDYSVAGDIAVIVIIGLYILTMLWIAVQSGWVNI